MENYKIYSYKCEKHKLEKCEICKQDFYNLAYTLYDYFFCINECFECNKKGLMYYDFKKNKFYCENHNKDNGINFLQLFYDNNVCIKKINLINSEIKLKVYGKIYFNYYFDYGINLIEKNMLKKIMPSQTDINFENFIYSNKTLIYKNNNL